MAAFADAFSRSFGMGAQLAMKQKQIGAEYAWREQQETTRQRERGEDITRKAGVREGARTLAAKIRGEDVTYRGKRNVLEATRYKDTTARKDKEFTESKRQRSLDRQNRIKIAGMKKAGGMDRWRVVLERGRKHYDIAEKYITEQLGTEPAAFNALQILNGEMSKLKNKQPVSRERMSRARDMLEEALGGADMPTARKDAERILGIETLMEFME
jgi:hypothetical protein